MSWKTTQSRISSHLQQLYPNGKGYSIRSIGRFCSANGIHKTSRFTSVELDSAVSGAIAKVITIVCFGGHLVQLRTGE